MVKKRQKLVNAVCGRPLTQILSYGQSLLLKYQPYTDQFFGLGQQLDSIQKWNKYVFCLFFMRSLGHTVILEHFNIKE